MPGEALTHADALPYRPPTGRAPRVWAGAVLVLAGVVLVGLGGCFLLGALILLRPHLVGPPSPAPPAMPSGGDVLYPLLVGAGVLCLAGALVTLFLGTRGLVRVLEGRTDTP